MCQDECIRRRQQEATTTVRGRLLLIPVCVMAVSRSLFVTVTSAVSGRPLEESASASWVPTGSHLVALSSDRALVCPIGSAILPDLLDHPCTRSPLEARSSWSVPQSISADLSRSGLRFKLQQSQNSRSPWLCPSPPLRPHDTYPAGPTRNSHTILGCCLSTLALIFGANHAIRLFSETPCRRRHSLLPILPFFLGRLIIFHSMLVSK